MAASTPPLPRRRSAVAGSPPPAGGERPAPAARPSPLGQRRASPPCSRRISAAAAHDDAVVLADAPEPSFSVRAPSGWSDDDDSGGDEGHSRRRSGAAAPPATGIRRLSEVEEALLDVTARLQQQLQLQTLAQVAAFDRALLDIEESERRALEDAATERHRHAAAAAATDAERQQHAATERQQLLASLRGQHDRQAAEERQRVEAAEAATRLARQAEELKARQARDAAAAAADKARAAAAATTAPPPALPPPPPPTAPSAVGILSAAPSAEAAAAANAAALAAAREAARPFADDRALRDKKRAIDKFVTLNLQQVSATREQVRAKGGALAAFIGQQAGAQRAYALVALAGKLLSQCEVQVTRLPAFAFPLAEVAAAVAAAHPDFSPVLLARAAEACPLAVPRYWGCRPGADEAAYLRLAGHRVDVDDATGRVTAESTDEFVGRAAGYVRLLAALAQSDAPGNPHGLGEAWAWLARFLNAVPATRVTAAALDAYLRVAGWRLAGAYRGQFAKLLRVVDERFLPELARAADADARAVHTRLRTYLQARGYAEQPEGRALPLSDASSYDRA